MKEGKLRYAGWKKRILWALIGEPRAAMAIRRLKCVVFVAEEAAALGCSGGLAEMTDA